MKNILIIFLCFWCTNQAMCQNQKLPSGNGFIIFKKDKCKILEKEAGISQYNPENLDSLSRWTFFLTKSSINLYLERDSSLYFFHEANRLNPKGTCKIMTVLSKSITANESWYLRDLPGFDELAFLELCSQQFQSGTKVSDVKDTTALSEFIRRRDQKYRILGDLTLQQEMDQSNRELIDSLYNTERSLDSFTREEIYQFSMVVHHSEDCEWVYKWTERLIEHRVTGYDGMMLLGPLLDRMFKVQDGHCTRQDAQKRDYFVYMLKNRYPDFFKKNKVDW